MIGIPGWPFDAEMDLWLRQYPIVPVTAEMLEELRTEEPDGALSILVNKSVLLMVSDDLYSRIPASETRSIEQVRDLLEIR